MGRSPQELLGIEDDYVAYCTVEALRFRPIIRAARTRHEAEVDEELDRRSREMAGR